MKSSNFAKKILFILLFLALALFVACSNSYGKDTVDTDSVSDNSTDDADPAGNTDSEPADDTDTATDDNSTDDSDEPAGDTDTDSEPTDPAEPTTEEPEHSFEQDAAGCTRIEVPKITMGGSHADEINGYFSPAMGENSIDIIRMYLLGEIEEGIYELGTGLNSTYTGCQQCVMVWVDAALATANEYYFQTAGTMEITEVRDVDGIQRTVGRISNLILKQVEPLNDYLGDFGFISDGGCIAAEIVEWDTTNTPGNTGD